MPRRRPAAETAPAPGGAVRRRVASGPGPLPAPGAAVRLLAPVLAAALLLGAIPGATAEAQAPGDRAGRSSASSDFRASPYLPTDHWAYDVLDRWIADGRVDGLSPLTRPWRRMDVARAVRELGRQRLDARESSWLARLRDEFRLELDRLSDPSAGGYLRGRFGAGGTYRSQTHRDPLRAELDGRFSEATLQEYLSLDVTGAAGVVAGAFRARRDGQYTEDPQFPDGRVVREQALSLEALGIDEFKVRPEEAYLELQTEYARLGFGRMDRNWGLPRLHGFTRSDYAYSYEELSWRVGGDRIFVTGTLTQLGDAGGDTTRHLSTHRLEVRPADGLVLAATEAVIHGGPSRPLDLGFVNPLGIWHLEGGSRNAVGQVDAWWRPARGLVLYGSLLADATNAPAGEDPSCCQMGGTVGLELPVLSDAWGARVQLSSVQSLTYRTRLPWEEWSVRGLGLGWDKADLHLLTLEGEWMGRPGLVVRPRLDVQALGERSDFSGDLRPPGEELPDFPRVLVGEEEVTVRPSVNGRWRPATLGDWSVELSWDLGVSFVRDADHVAGDDRTEFVGDLRAVVRTPRALLSLD